ncbi:hypothetical protein BDV39DRAFT_207230 [Aspergillus sergii]|uniref:Fungal calcium binding protein-domain-containing protein n=1 Tax=Aspergillus sergii TaxID=1034303 RepID=A0A5N6WYG5_9EURO|nr:hypothetical protein BDV39DRAFT_207230 [Aspergillus sergii]
MKIQTLFSLATVGLAFANPIQNLEARDDYTDCVISSVKKDLSQVCTSTEICGNRADIISCVTKALDGAKIDVGEIIHLPATLGSCIGKVKDGLEAIEWRRLEGTLSHIASKAVTSCSQSGQSGQSA